MVSTTQLWDQASEILTEAQRTNEKQIDEAAGLILDTIRADALVFSAGAGHSLAAVAETFYRAGGLANVYPLYHPELLPLHGAQHSTATERRSGLADEVLDQKPPGPGDVLVVFSTSGVNPYPVELAISAKKRGASVISVTSRACIAAAPKRSSSTLAAEGTVVIDTGIRVGDSSYPAEAPVTAPLSTVVNAYLWNLVLTRVLDLGTAAGVDVPLWRSSNVEGGDAANASLLSRYVPRIPALA
ncbi:Uncharacterized protein, contains SIS (Sugar ISomerase) phosphosugar binding domain [Amycolatopsis xylanica]|uniref:Uncharacterized protein, contains SIS (Sugar ISomerase) phosphosugar binding domain n=1 Tax=Amycolatopsis xylanica TaxID=589385 RepID=A0A1H3JHY7_9PSEU|nr:SIS domain-containing protein [Amycolatopsis xylanica]SDY39541.1 Uncharacterized protein, contains SIS (Sugar ISomerase) phosphosugar binding domain [Amycolatopsis xylanica]